MLVLCELLTQFCFSQMHCRPPLELGMLSVDQNTIEHIYTWICCVFLTSILIWHDLGHLDNRYKEGVPLLSSTNLYLYISLSAHSFLFVLHFLHLLLSLLLSDGRVEGCYIPDDCHHHRLSVRPALTSQKGSEPASQTAGLWKQMQTAPCPPFASNCQANFMQTFEMSPKNRMWIRCVFITCVGSE